METDTVILEVSRVEEKLAKKYNYGIAAMVNDARTRQRQSDRKVVDRSAKL